jgi:hypothetical protein
MQAESESFDHGSKRRIPQRLEDVVTAVDRGAGLILYDNFYLFFRPAGGKPLFRLGGDRFDDMKTIDLKTLETLEKL